MIGHSKEKLIINKYHDKIVDKLLRTPIPAKPNVGELGGLFNGKNFLNLSALQKKYGKRWVAIAEILKKYLEQKKGKRLRPLLLLYGYKMFSRKKELPNKILTASIGVELAHETALILDDIMDSSKLRRGSPSLWAIIAKRMDINFIDAKKIAAELGALCFSWARHLVVDESEEKIRPNVEKMFWKTVNKTKRGQTLDVSSMHASNWPELKKSIDWLYMKTAPYSVEFPLTYALYATKLPTKQHKQVIDGIKMFARGFGLAFQLHDDLLILKTNKEIGKESATDAFNGNKIPLAVIARQLGNNKQKQFLDSVWGHKENLTPKNVKKLKTLFKKTGALDKINQMIVKESKEAETGLKKIKEAGFNTSAVQILLNKTSFS